MTVADFKAEILAIEQAQYALARSIPDVSYVRPQKARVAYELGKHIAPLARFPDYAIETLLSWDMTPAKLQAAGVSVVKVAKSLVRNPSGEIDRTATHNALELLDQCSMTVERFKSLFRVYNQHPKYPYETDAEAKRQIRALNALGMTRVEDGLLSITYRGMQRIARHKAARRI